MPRSALTGTRIRERRTVLGLRQADLARRAGISPSYLNLIEHNRRRIGGRLLVELARHLGVEASVLTEGAGAALIETLREAAAVQEGGEAEIERIEEFAGRFPGWAALLAARHRRVRELERTVEMLTDRMTHDPFLSASLHEVISTVTAIRSTAAILAETEDIDPDWQRRFHRNLSDDSRRLAEGAQSLVAYLDEGAEDPGTQSSPQEEVEAFLKARDYHLPELEAARPADPADLVAAAGELTSAPARELLLGLLARYRRDAERMPLEPFAEAARAEGFDPGRLAARFGVDPAAAFRRLAALPGGLAGGPVGLVICDGSGTLTFRKPVEGFALPRFGAACPLWPLYQALARPMAPLRAVVEPGGPMRLRFLTYALCQPALAGGFDGPQVLEAAMLILPADTIAIPDGQAQPIGTSCRICPRRTCVARREPSILADGF
ncbi:short-chain fatty acyl-CoA regulator family protein [Rhodovulum tesquicola]|uniref:helix-turn-helix transcriptional regulator n=1 Tax=Rhodovulum tesquicola TaxID=540254 RepID=UPI0020975177|nr:helix-turn-helix transcriptional regulator [Rhodovulum tesquicola]MCO8146390.1 short-chain fatty acyl-CoA regulator family protein [Rhodovulum tesquicola]